MNKQLIKKIRSIKDIYIFDVDGTLTPSRGKINKEFSKWFLKWLLKKEDEIYLVTGSDHDKTVEQIGENLFCAVDTVFNCSGNSIWHGGQEIYKCDWSPPEELIIFLEDLLNLSPYQLRTGKHIEQRIGMVNFSVVGRGATFPQRKTYHEYDLENQERYNFAQLIKNKFKDLEVQVAGETGIDIFPLGKDKSQIIEYFLPSDELSTIHFFGDKLQDGGNDKPLADVIVNQWKGDYKLHPVNNWEQTFSILKSTVIK